MTERREPWDWPEEPRRGRRRPPPVLEGKILKPEIEVLPGPHIHHVEIVHHHRRQGPTPQRVVIIAAFAILALVLLRSAGALILLGALTPGFVWKALVIIIAALCSLVDPGPAFRPPFLSRTIAPNIRPAAAHPYS
jgi:hypothetical protein